jgi:homoserine kinase
MGFGERPVLVRVPATSANLGPGFDTLGLALALHDEVEARVTRSGLDIEVTGEGSGNLGGAGERHLIVRAMRVAFDELNVPQPAGLALRCVNRIPHGRGLGSSAAAIVAGLLAARGLAGAPVAPEDVLQLANMLEGHPDNVAPCLFGGLTIAWVADGSDAGDRLPRARAIRLDPRADVHPVAFVAPDPVSTSVARGLLPPSVPHADAARNAGRAALLIAALTARPDALLDGTEDKLHQDYRAPAMPHSHDLVTRLRAAGVPAVISGAGPSVLAFLTGSPAGNGNQALSGNPGHEGLSLMDSIAAETGIDWHITPLDVERRGASVASSVSGAHDADAEQTSPSRLNPLFCDMDGCKGMPWALSVLGWVQHRLPRSGAGAVHPRVAWGVTYTCPGIGLLASPQESVTFP